MIALVRKLREVENEVAAERGGIVLVALFQREDSLGKWDVLFSADWIKRTEDERPVLDYLIGKLQPKLTQRELLTVSRVLVFEPNEQFVGLVLGMLQEWGNPQQLANISINGMSITTAYIIAADLNYAPLPAVPDPESMIRETAEILDAMRPDAARP